MIGHGFPVGMFLVATALVGLHVDAKDYYVAPGGTGDYLTAATPGSDPNWCARKLALSAGDVIHLAAGTYVLGDTPNVNQQIFLQKGVTIVGATDDPADTVIDGGGRYRTFCCTYTSTVRNLTMRNGGTTAEEGQGHGFGGGVCAQSDAYPDYFVSNCIVENCSATYRGGGGSHGIWRDCVIRNCRVTYQGYVQKTDGSAADLRSEGSGGGVWAGKLYNCVVTNNYAGFAGGGIAAGGDVYDPCEAHDCLIGWNEAGNGGGAGARGGTSTDRLRLYGCTLVSNTTHNVPGYDVSKGGGTDNAYLTNCVVRGNDVQNAGGGILRSVAEDCLIAGNAAHNPNNYAKYGGGGSSQSVLRRCVLTDNAAPFGGGSHLGELHDCVITNNRATTSNGGGIFGGKSFNCVVAFNQALNGGSTENARGAICSGYHQGALVYSNRFVNGAAVTAMKGATDITIVNCTIFDNLANNQNGFNSGYATNCLIFGHVNTDVYNCKALVNCFWRIDGRSSTPQLSDPTLDLAQNCLFGKTLDPGVRFEMVDGLLRIVPKSRSLCRDAGLLQNWMTDAVDLAGTPRVSGNLPDIGAFEYDTVNRYTMLIVR